VSSEPRERDAAPAVDFADLALRVVYAARVEARGVPLVYFSRVFDQLDALFAWAWELSDDEKLAARAQSGESAVWKGMPQPFNRAETPQAPLYRVHYGSPLEVVAGIPLDFLVDMGKGAAALAALLVLAERAFTFPVRVKAKREQWRTEKRKYELQRSAMELEYIDALAERIRDPRLLGFGADFQASSAELIDADDLD
jgi:hypothetical protein